MRRGSFARAGGRFWAAARYGSEESSFISQIHPVLNPRSSATWARVNPSASPRFTERLSSRAISFSTESSWFNRRRSLFPPPSKGSAISLSYLLVGESISAKETGHDARSVSSVWRCAGPAHGAIVSKVIQASSDRGGWYGRVGSSPAGGGALSRDRRGPPSGVHRDGRCRSRVAAVVRRVPAGEARPAFGRALHQERARLPPDLGRQRAAPQRPGRGLGTLLRRVLFAEVRCITSRSRVPVWQGPPAVTIAVVPKEGCYEREARRAQREGTATGRAGGCRVGAGRARQRQDHLAEPPERPPVPAVRRDNHGEGRTEPGDRRRGPGGQAVISARPRLG